MDNERTLVESHVFLICLIFYLSYYVYSFFSYFPCWFKECIWFGLSDVATVIHMRLQSTINVEN